MAKDKEEVDVLQAALDQINKSIGKGTVYEYRNFEGEERERIPTGTLTGDIITGGGWVRGLMNYVSGGFSASKSTLCALAIRETQKKGLKAVYIDHEYSLDLGYLAALGVDVDNLIISQPDCIEDGYQIFCDLVETGKIGTVIFDSIAAAQTRKELEGDVGDQTMGVKAKLNAVTFPKITMLLKKHNAVGLMVNQNRVKIGIAYGSPIYDPGGEAVKFFPSIKIEVNQSTKEKGDDGDIVGNLIKIKCTKNKTARPFMEGEYTINYGTGIDNVKEVFTIGYKIGLIQRAGAYFSYLDTKLGQGEGNAVETLRDNPDLTGIIEKQIREHYEI